MSEQSSGTYMSNGCRVEMAWTDKDGVYGRVTSFDETRLEQVAPDDAAAMISLGHHRVEKTHSMGRDRERKWIELTAGSYLTADQAVELALLLLESAAAWRAEQSENGPPQGPVAEDDPRRWDLHVAACALRDHTIWIEKTANGWQAVEVETGCQAAEAPTAREAMDNYWNHVWPVKDPGTDPHLDEQETRS